MSINVDVAVQMLARIVIAERTGTAKRAWNQRWYATLKPRRGDEPLTHEGGRIEELVRHPEACGTAFCAAGFVVSDDPHSEIRWDWEEDDQEFQGYVLTTGETIPDRAARLLNIEEPDSALLPRLFNGGNDLGDLFEEVARLAVPAEAPSLDALWAMVEARIEMLTQDSARASSATP